MSAESLRAVQTGVGRWHGVAEHGRLGLGAALSQKNQQRNARAAEQQDQAPRQGLRGGRGFIKGRSGGSSRCSAGAAPELGTEGLHRFGFGEGQAGGQPFGVGQRFAGAWQLALAGSDFGLHIVRFGAVGVADQDLLDHGLGFVELAAFCGAVDLVHGGFGLRNGSAPDQQHGQSACAAKAAPNKVWGAVQKLHLVTPVSGMGAPAHDVRAL